MSDVDKAIEAAIRKGISESFLLGLRDGLGLGAIIARQQAERIKHTSHADGLGMGSLCCEKTCGNVAEAILERLAQVKP